MNKVLLGFLSFLLKKTIERYCKKFNNECLKCRFGYGLDECRKCILKDAYWSVVREMRYENER